MKKILALVLAACMMFSMLACASKAPTEEAAPAAEAAPVAEKTEPEKSSASEASVVDASATYKKHLIIAHSQAPVSVSCQEAYSGMQKILNTLTFNQLLDFDKESKQLVGELASEYSVEENGKVWILKLRDGVKFQNGEVLKADDVVYTFERAAESGVSTKGITSSIEKVEALDDLTVKFSLVNANMDFGFDLCQTYASILNRKASEEDPENGIGIGTGGWKISNFVANDYVDFDRFDESWVWEKNGLTPTEKLTLKYYSDTNARCLAVQAGDIDVALIANMNEIDTYKAIDTINVDVPVSWSCDFVGMNSHCEYFKDINVRKAVAYALNREEALNIVVNGYGLVCDSFWCPDALGYKETLAENYTFDLAKAKELMAASAYPDGFTCKLTTINAYSLYAETVQAQLAQIGINCEVDLTDSPGMAENGKNDTFEMFVWNNTMKPYPDYMKSAFIPGSANYFNYDNPEVVELMTAAVAEPDTAKRAEMYGQVQEIVNADCYCCPLFFGFLCNLTAKNVTGCNFEATAYDFTYITCTE